MPEIKLSIQLNWLKSFSHSFNKQNYFRKWKSQRKFYEPLKSSDQSQAKLSYQEKIIKRENFLIFDPFNEENLLFILQHDFLSIHANQTEKIFYLKMFFIFILHRFSPDSLLLIEKRFSLFACLLRVHKEENLKWWTFPWGILSK